MGGITTLEWLFGATGVLLAVSGIFGGGFEILKVKVPRLNAPARTLAIAFGLGFVALAILPLWSDGGAGSTNGEGSPGVHQPPNDSPPSIVSATHTSEVTVVDVLGVGTTVSSHGFFTSKGTVILFLPNQDATQVSLAWEEGRQEVRATARILKKGAQQAPFLALAALIGRTPPATSLPIRIAASLTVNDQVWRYLGENDRAPGWVIEVRSVQGQMWGQYSLLTSLISSSGDAGAPVIDDQGNVVSVILGAANDGTYTISLPIELIKNAFPAAF